MRLAHLALVVTVTACGGPVSPPSTAARADGKADSAGVAPRCCVCFTGDDPGYQVPFFDLGCSAWLGDQNHCAVSTTVSVNSSYQLPAQCAGLDARVGYVGHWDASMTEAFIAELAEQVCIDGGHNLSIHNTACDFLEYAQDVQDFINSLPIPDGVQLVAQGSQSVSTGELPAFLLARDSSNPQCTVEYGWSTPQYPRCKHTLGEACEAFQAGESGVCQNDDGSLHDFVCCIRNITQTVGAKCIEGTLTRWEKGASCEGEDPHCE